MHLPHWGIVVFDGFWAIDRALEGMFYALWLELE